jgi:hypothetical protein
VLVKMVNTWTSKHMVVGSTSTTLKKKISFIHTFIIYSIQKVFPIVVEVCLKNSLLQYSSVQRDPNGKVPSRI